MNMLNFNANAYQIHELKSIYNEVGKPFNINLFSNYTSNDIVKCKMELYNQLIQKNPNQMNEINVFLEQSSKILLQDINTPNLNDKISSLFLKPVEKDTLNPNVKNITRKIINIDSQYRENILPYSNNPNDITSSTNFLTVFNDKLNNVLEYTLYSIQIPFTWYVIDKAYNNNFFFVESTSITEPVKIEIESGNYTPQELVLAINQAINNASTISWADNSLEFSYNSNNSLISILNNTGEVVDIVFFDYTDSRFIVGEKHTEQPKIDHNLGWILGFRNYNEFLLDYEIQNEESVQAEAICDLNGPKYFSLLIDDFNQNSVNKGLVTIDPNRQFIQKPSYFNTKGNVTTLGNCNSDPNNHKPNLTKAQIYTINNINNYRQTFASENNSRSHNVTTSNIMCIIPLEVNNLTFGKMFNYDGPALDNNSRTFFGPVNIEKMKFRIIDDKGRTVNLNGGNWCCTIISDHLYQY